MSNRDSEIQKMLDDPDTWDEPKRAPKKSEKRQRGAMISVRLTEDELAHVQRVAKEHQMSVAAFIRNRAIQSKLRWIPDTPLEMTNATNERPDDDKTAVESNYVWVHKVAG